MSLISLIYLIEETKPDWAVHGFDFEDKIK